MIMTMRVTRVVPQRSSIWGNKVMRSITPLAGRSILVVGDEPLIAGNLWELFEAEGADVHLRRRRDCPSAVVDFGSNGDGSAWFSQTLRAHGNPDLKETAGVPVLHKPASEGA